MNYPKDNNINNSMLILTSTSFASTTDAFLDISLDNPLWSCFFSGLNFGYSSASSSILRKTRAWKFTYSMLETSQSQ